MNRIVLPAAERSGARGGMVPMGPPRQAQRPYMPDRLPAHAQGMQADDKLASRQPREPYGSPGRLVDELLRAAVAAPSMHNTQPWRFRVKDAGGTIELRADPVRILPLGDPEGRAAHIACGAALLNLRLAVAVAGLRPDIRLLPAPGQPLLLAEIRLAGRHHPTRWERELHAAIWRRQTNREPFSNRPVPPGIRAELAEAACLEGATLAFLDREEAGRVLRLAAEAERDLLANPAYRAELARWAGGYRDRDGIPGTALGPRSPEGRSPVRDFNPDRHPGPTRYGWFEEHPQLAVLSADSGGPLCWLAAGQALQRAWLTATCRGIAVSPLTQPLETAEAWLVRNPRSAAGPPQMILRIGYGLPLPPGAPRRPVTEVIDEPRTPAPGALDPGGAPGHSDETSHGSQEELWDIRTHPWRRREAHPARRSIPWRCCSRPPTWSTPSRA
jgi:nitroreductase